jgi:AcrR family transcriptional regulator
MSEELSLSRFAAAAPPPTPRRRRGQLRPASKPIGAEDYFQAALDILAESGAESLTTSRLCERLRITKGSFYYHFEGMDDFVAGFADYRESILNDLLAVAAAEADPLVRMSSAINLIAMLPHEAEAAVRAWSQSNKVLEASQRRIDRACTSLAIATAGTLLGDPARAGLVGRQLIALIVGMQQVDRPVGREHVVRMLAAFGESSCGLIADIDESSDIPVVEFRRR